MQHVPWKIYQTGVKKMSIAARKINYDLDNNELNNGPEISETAYRPENHLFERQSYISQYNWNQPYLETKDVVGLGLAILMTLGPLAAYAVGFGA
jgi:hypothetical protein